MIEVAGEEDPGLYQDLLSLEVELDDEMAAMAILRLSMRRQPDGRWTYLDDERFAVFNDMTVNAGFEGVAEPLFGGYVTQLRPWFDPEPGNCVLEVWAMDATVLMDRQERIKDWPDKKDSDIALEVFAAHGLDARLGDTVLDTRVVHDRAVSTILQRETDIRFLRRLALRNGYECFVEGETAFFRPPRVEGERQPVLAAHFGADTTLTSFSAEVNALPPADVAAVQLDRLNKTVLEEEATVSDSALLGDRDLAALLPAGQEPGRVWVGMNAATGSAEMAALCQGLYQEGAWFVTAEGVVAANKYGHVLRPRQPVTIKGVGETFSGDYYVTRTRHVFGLEGYSQSFRAKRNAVFPTGDERFAGGGGPDLL
ncbi:phage late control D family protein [Halomonas ramblicola]|uniref:phage late control D family protein n=1 Tax=Halomonas ramblicola TaxID=747349 RepID=UPI0025B4BC24|nr:hypothetical protein [Halomonas ramblicola]MDN3522558.1 hypothetical protein [Halomonas ramblicola]